jgi:hypothetical protein
MGSRAVRFVLGIGGLAAGLLGFFPPWEERLQGEHRTIIIPRRHYLIFAPPPTRRRPASIATHQIDVTRLVIYWSAIALSTAGLVAIVRSRREGEG